MIKNWNLNKKQIKTPKFLLTDRDYWGIFIPTNQSIQIQ